jgi:hypothetical protein
MPTPMWTDVPPQEPSTCVEAASTSFGRGRLSQVKIGSTCSPYERLGSRSFIVASGAVVAPSDDRNTMTRKPMLRKWCSEDFLGRVACAKSWWRMQTGTTSLTSLSESVILLFEFVSQLPWNIAAKAELTRSGDCQRLRNRRHK